MRLPVVLSALAALVLTTSAARADDPVAAEALFRAGREAVARGDHVTACARFAESQRLDPAPGTLINLGDCKAHQKLYASAWQHYKEAEDRLAGDPRLSVVRRKLDEVTPHLSKLTIVLAPSAPPGSVVMRDGEMLGSASLGVALPIDRGQHTLVVTAPGRAPQKVTVDLDVGERKTALVDAGPPVAVAPAQAPAPSNGLRIGGFVVGAVGVLGFAASMATGAMTLARKGVVDDPAHCTADLRCDPTGVKAASEGKTLSAVSTATFVVGLAAIGAGTAMVIVGSKKAPAAAIAPVVSPGGAALFAVGMF